MSSEAQRQANKRYRERLKNEGRVKSLCLTFYPGDLDVYNWLQEHKPVATYIKELIRKDMSNGNG